MDECHQRRSKELLHPIEREVQYFLGFTGEVNPRLGQGKDRSLCWKEKEPVWSFVRDRREEENMPIISRGRGK